MRHRQTGKSTQVSCQVHHKGLQLQRGSMCHKEAHRSRITPPPSIRREMSTTQPDSPVQGGERALCHVPAINIQPYLRAQRPKRTTRAKNKHFVKTNTVERSVCLCTYKPNQNVIKNSFFVRTTCYLETMLLPNRVPN